MKINLQLLSHLVSKGEVKQNIDKSTHNNNKSIFEQVGHVFMYVPWFS